MSAEHQRMVKAFDRWSQGHKGLLHQEGFEAGWLAAKEDAVARLNCCCGRIHMHSGVDYPAADACPRCTYHVG